MRLLRKSFRMVRSAEQADAVAERLRYHYRDKEFWDRGVEWLCHRALS